MRHTLLPRAFEYASIGFAIESHASRSLVLRLPRAAVIGCSLDLGKDFLDTVFGFHFAGRRWNLHYFSGQEAHSPLKSFLR
jgi:hypothetical protein